MKRIIFIIVLVLFPFNIHASAQSFVVMDSESLRLLAGENYNSQMLIASTTKIMTAIVALENDFITTEYTVGTEINSVYGSMVYLKVGENISLEELLYALLLRSGNDAAMVIANNVSSYDNFIYLMNKKASELGMKNTIFQNPHGLDDDTKNYSTAYDMALLMSYAIKNEEFVKISSTKKYKCSTNLNDYLWYNKNDLLGLYKYSTAGKIGYTTKSKHVFVSSASKDNKNLVIVTFKDTNQFQNHYELYEKYFSKYKRYQILNKDTFLFSDPLYKDYYLYIKNDFFVLLSESEKNNIKLEFNILEKKNIDNDEIGFINIFLNNELIHKEKIYAIKEKYKVNKIKSILFFWKK